MESFRIAPATVLLEMSEDFSGHRARREDSWYGYSEGKTWGAIPFAVSNLFRGQTTRHFPLLPSIARGLQSVDIDQWWRSPLSDQAKLLLRLAQSWWFSQELKRHPIAKHAAGQHLDLDEIGLAQHYGLSTGYLDLTDDIDVAAFFATCRQSPNGWEPVEQGIGVIYWVTLKTLENPFGMYTPLGPQLLPRPTEQCAWVAELPLCHSFEGWPNVKMMQFHHDRRVGEHYLNIFDGGKKLFPKDPLADVAAEILGCREIPGVLIDAALDLFAKDPNGVLVDQVPTLRKEIGSMVVIVNGRQLLSDQQISSLLTDPEWDSKMFADVKVRWKAVRRVPIHEQTVRHPESADGGEPNNGSQGDAPCSD